MSLLLECQDVTMRFGGLVALDGLDFELRQGETVGLVGPNGSGKTTFFNVLTGFYRASNGSIMMGGDDLFAKPPQVIARSGVARTFQRSRLMLDQSAFDNIALGALRDMELSVGRSIFRRKAFRQELDALIDRVSALVKRFSPSVAARLFQPAGAFPMIDRRRIEICRALIASPKLLLLDEPSAGMTPDETRGLMDEVLTFRREMPTLSIILVEHEMDVIRRVSDRCVVLNFGRKIFQGSFDDLISDREVQTAYLGGSE